MRPWQHVYWNPYLLPALAENLTHEKDNYGKSAFNFGPDAVAFAHAQDLVEETHGNTAWTYGLFDNPAPHEANLLSLTIEKAESSCWQTTRIFGETIRQTMICSREVLHTKQTQEMCVEQIQRFLKDLQIFHNCD